MFGIGIPELMLILILALVVLGPDKLPKLARQIAKFVGDLKRASEDFKEQLNVEVDGIDDIRELKEMANLKNPEVWKKNFDKLVNVHEPADHLPHGPDNESTGSTSESGDDRGQGQPSDAGMDKDMDVINPVVDLSAITDTGRKAAKDRSDSNPGQEP